MPTDPKAVSLLPTSHEAQQRDAVVAALLDAIRSNQTIKLPPFDPKQSQASTTFALLSVGVEKNPYGGTVGPYRYQFEGEEDLLHLIVTRQNGDMLTPEEGQAVVGFLIPRVPAALVWLKPGERSQHFFLGHDDLLAAHG